MSVKAKLIIDEQEINVLYYHYEFRQKADVSGRPSAKPLFVGLVVEIETRKDLNLADWAFANKKTKQLELHIYSIIEGVPTRKLYFYDCHLLHWKNHFFATDNQPIIERLEISAGGVKDSKSTKEYTAYWRETYGYQDTLSDQNNTKNKEIKVKAQLS